MTTPESGRPKTEIPSASVEEESIDEGLITLLQDHADLARQGLERVAALHPGVSREDIEETHQLIRDAHAEALPKLGKQRQHPNRI